MINKKGMNDILGGKSSYKRKLSRSIHAFGNLSYTCSEGHSAFSLVSYDSFFWVFGLYLSDVGNQCFLAYALFVRVA